MGAYEHMFGANKEDGGLLNIPSYECLGNHDWDTDYDVPVAKKYPISTDNYKYFDEKPPPVEMQLRRSHYRKYLVNKDEHGNYSCDWGDLHVLFLNVWPSTFKLYEGKPTGTLEFLKSDLKTHGHKKWMLVTHCIPDFDNWDKTYHGEAVLKDFGVIFDQYKDTCLGSLSGHTHIKSGDFQKKNTGLKRYVLPGPAAHAGDLTELELPLFSFNKTTQENTLFILTATVDEYGNKYKVMSSCIID